MHRAANLLRLLSLATALLGLAGCGGSTYKSPSTGSPTAPTGGKASLQYQVSLFSQQGGGSGTFGQVTVDTGGTVTLQLSGGTASTTFSLQFCPAPAQNYTCLSMGTVTSDASGNANTTMKFPQSGSWAGDFQLTLNGTSQYTTDVMPGSSSAVYMAALQPAATVNGKGGFLTGTPPPQAPLTSGILTLSNGVLQVQLTGALASTLYQAGECPLFAGSNCYALYDSNRNGAFKTDVSGNVTFSVLLDSVGGDIFDIDPEVNQAGQVGGFKVP